MLQRLGIRGKLLAVVAVPILVLVLASGFITFGSVQDLNSARNTASLIDTLGGTRALENVLQDERRAAVNYVTSETDGAEALTAAVSETGYALTQVTSAIDGLVPEPDAEDQEDRSGEIRDRVAGVLGATENSGVFESERAVDIVEGAVGEWATFPDEPTIAAMSEGYESAATGIESIAEDSPGSVAEPLRELATQIRAENEAAQAAYVEPARWQQALQEVYPGVDAAIEALLGRAEELASDDRNQAAVASLLEGRALLDNLDSTRASTMSLSALPASLTGYYDGVLGRVAGASDDVVVAVTDAELIENLRAYGDLTALDERLLREGLLAERIIRVGAFAPDGGEVNLLQDFQLRTNLALEDAQSSSLSLGEEWAVPPFGASEEISGDRAESFVSTRTSISSGIDFSLSQESPDVWAAAVQAEADAYEESRSAVLAEIEDRSSSLTQAAVTQLLLTIAISVLVIIVSIVVALLIARRITGPLRRLTTTATAVRQELPRLVERVAMPGETVDVTEVQIPVESRDEVGRLAEAFNGVNAATLAIAGEQAALRGSISEMFVNVARRDQVLLNRQLSSIDEMERSEDNQETLTKLFALDHLATRMRRNSESLLVLAGIDTGRRLRRPMPLSDVVRTASSEIELYERVQLELDADPSMLGHSALTAAHLFAELLENATVFSDPDSPVVVRTAEHGDEFVVEIEDSGIGMTEKELEAANNRVASTAASEILGAQRLGLFVVGRIARRVGARVELQSTEGEGTLATVTMPRALFARDEQAEPRQSAPATVDAATHAPVGLVTHHGADEILDSPRLSEGAGVDAYTPTAIEEGVSLSGRGDIDAGDPDSIDALIAADAAAAPTAEATRPEDLTSGSSPSGLPARRRREAPTPADTEREEKSIVGLPARATDAQLSALAAAQPSGFIPAISPTEIAPQSPEQRSSMFRGFRSRRETEEQVGAEQETAEAQTSFAPALPVRGARPEPAPEPVLEPVLEADGDEPDATENSPSSAPSAEEATPEVAAAAFFSRRERHRGTRAEEPDRTASSATELRDDDNDGVPVFRMPTIEPSSTPAATPVFEQDEPEPSQAAPVPAVDEGPFVVPLLEVDEDEPYAPADQAGLHESDPDKSDTDESGHEDSGVQDNAVVLDDGVALEDDADLDGGARVDDSAASYDSVPSLGSAPESEDSLFGQGGLPQRVSPYDPPVGHDEPSIDQAARFPWENEPAAQPQAGEIATPAQGFMPAPVFQDEPSEEHAEQEHTEQQSPTDQPAGDWAPVLLDAEDSAPAPAEPEQSPSPQVATPLAGAVPLPTTAPVDVPAPPASAQTPASSARFATPAGGGEPQPASEQSPSLDDLIQSAVDEETEQRPGFFSRLFGRGRRGETAAEPKAMPATGALAAGGATAQWASTSAQGSAPSVASAPVAGVYAPEAEQPASAPSWHSAPQAASAQETSFAPQTSFAPEGSPAPQTSFAPEPTPAPATSFAPEPADPAQTEPEPAQAAPASAAPWEQTEPAQPVAQPQPWETPQSFQPLPDASPAPDFAAQDGTWEDSQTAPSADPPESTSASAFTADELAQASGWEAAGASALEAAEPEGATTYQPVIQPDTGSDGGADLASAVFSELSSLASERPKVEKTRAGLQRRRPVDAAPVEVTPIEADAALAPAERDADAVRSRFNSFYSGTKKARDDVAAFQRQTEPAEANDS